MKLLKPQDQETSPAKHETESNAWKHLWSLKDAMDHMFNDRFWTPFGDRPRSMRAWERLSPKIDVKDKDNQFIIKADVPGVDDDKLSVEVTENMVCLSGRIEHEEEKEEENMHYREREEGKFRRDILLPAKVDANSVQASIHNGLLTITLNKQKEEERKKIEVKKS